MPSLDTRTDRHVVIDRRAGHYLCFPDVCLTPEGTLLCVYNEFDRHVGARRRLLAKESRDAGRSWGPTRILRADDSHCPRLSLLPGGLLCLLDDAGAQLLWSADSGRNWAGQHGAGLVHGLMDRVQALDGQTLFTAAHLHRGSAARHKIRQAPAEQMAYISQNMGRSWEPLSVIAYEKCLVLCEASVIRLPGEASAPPRLLALMRENSFVGEPMYFCISDDGGANWSEPAPTPLIGHRPTLGWTASGKLLVTYRDVGPDPGTKAWLGSLDELCSDFAVHGLHPDPDSLRLTPEGLLVKSGPEAPVRYSLRPLTDPEHATASFEAEVLVRAAEAKGCAVRLGLWWRLTPDGILPDADNAGLVPWEPGRFHALRIDYEPGLCRLFVDGKRCGEYPVDRLSGETRPILAGVLSRTEANGAEVLWRRMALSTSEPRLDRRSQWRWDASQGLPDALMDARVLELKNDRRASLGDFGYSGWAETAPGEFFCAFHHGGGGEPGYVPGESAHVRGVWFCESDFS